MTDPRLPSPRLTKRDVADQRRRDVRTIDNWVRKGLLPPPRRDEAGRPFWLVTDLERTEAAS